MEQNSSHTFSCIACLRDSSKEKNNSSNSAASLAGKGLSNTIPAMTGNMLASNNQRTIRIPPDTVLFITDLGMCEERGQESVGEGS